MTTVTTTSMGIETNVEDRAPHDRSRACANCVRAKTRCSFVLATGTVCERCRRMNKDCQPQPRARKRKAPVRHAPNKVERLEEKINGLVDFLKSNAESGATSSKSASSNAASLDSNFVGPVNEVSPQVVSTGNYEEPILNPSFATNNNLFHHALNLSASSTPPTAPVNLFPGIESLSEPNAEDAESYLLNFSKNFTIHLPFLVIPPFITAYRLQQERPILWLCIMTVASKSTKLQMALSTKVRQLFGRVAYIEGGRNLDLLLGLLVLIAWDRQLGIHKPIFTSLVQLAISILYDLDLDKPPRTDMGFVLMTSVKGQYDYPSRSSRTPTMEERRTLLGCYLLSTVSSSSGKGQSLRWTPYFDECLQVLQDAKEFESDETLAHMVKLRLVSEKAVDFSSPCTAGHDPSEGIPATFYVKSLKSELHESAAAIPSRLWDNKSLLLERYYTEFRIHEIGFSQSSKIFINQPSLRFECLFACLQAIKSCCETLLTLESTEYLGLSAIVLAEMTNSLTSLCRLSMCGYPGWDQEIVHSTIDVSFFLGQLAKKYAQVREDVGINSDDSSHGGGGGGGNDYFTIKALKLRSMRASWDALTLPAISAQELESFSMDFLETWN